MRAVSFCGSAGDGEAAGRAPPSLSTIQPDAEFQERDGRAKPRDGELHEGMAVTKSGRILNASQEALALPPLINTAMG